MKLAKIFKKYKHEFILLFLICIYIVYFTTASFLRYDNFYAGRFDLGNMDQAVWNTINGRVFQTSKDNGAIISRLSGHADFILILLSPFYLLWPNPKTLLLIQTIVLSIGAFFVFLIAKHILKNKNLSLIFGFLFLMNPMVQFTNLYDFHAVVLATTFLLISFYFLLKRKYILLTIFLFLSGLAKEEVWIVTSLFGFPLLFKKVRKLKFLGIGIIFLSIAAFSYLLWVAIPRSSGGQYFALSYFSDFGSGNTPSNVILNILSSPQKIISIVFERSHLEYLGRLFMPIGFISFISPFSLLFAMPDLFINLLSNNSQLRQIYYQYTSTITPFIFISGVFGVKQFIKWFPKIPIILIASYLIFWTLLSAYFLGPMPGSRNPNIDMFIEPQEKKKIIESFLSRIPEKYSIAATNNLGSHLSHRQRVSTIPVGIETSDVVLFLLNDSFAQPSLIGQEKIVNKMLHNTNYVLVFREEDFFVFKKRGNLL